MSGFMLRVGYGKTGRLRYLGHLEVLGSIDRIVRRAGLPFAVSQGFSPHMRIAFSPALPVGALSECEWFDLMLTSLVPVEEALGALVDASPRELAPTRAAYVDPRSPALGAWLDRVDWEIRLVGGGLTVDCVRAALDDVVSSGHVDYLRSGKPRTVDLRRTLVSCDVRGTGPDVLLGFKTRSSNDGALRPDVLAGAILGDSRLEGASCELMDVRKIGQWHEGEDGLISPLDLAVTTSA